MRLAICLSHVIQYKSPLLAKLSALPNLDLQVFYYSDKGLVSKKNKYREIVYAWDLDLLHGYEFEFLPNRVNEEKWKFPVFQPYVNPDIYRRLRDGKFNAVMIHSYLYPSDWLAFLIAKQNGMAVIFYGEMFPRDLRIWPRRVVRSILHKTMLRHVDACLAIGSVAKDVYLNEYGVSAEKIFMAPYAVDNDFFISEVEKYRSKKNEIKAALGIPAEIPVVLCVAAMVPKKRQQDLVEAMRQIKIPAQLVLVGHGPLIEVISELCRQRLPSTILTGFINQSQLPSYYAIADVFVLPSVWEEFGLVVNEAMCAGLPVIASDGVAASRDLIYQGENGFTFRPYDVIGLVDKISDLLSDINRREKFGQCSRQLISRWSYDQTVQGILVALEYATGYVRNR
jgi:glycosyltransferase involved in cell wall biosynthesis